MTAIIELAPGHNLTVFKMLISSWIVCSCGYESGQHIWWTKKKLRKFFDHAKESPIR